jgi:hypothetical protein
MLSNSDVGYPHFIYRGKTRMNAADRRRRDAGKGTVTWLLRIQYSTGRRLFSPAN